MHIERYEFGLIVIDGQSYHHDLLIWPGHFKDDWWRQEAHLLQLEDVAEALAAAPQVLVVARALRGGCKWTAPWRPILRPKGSSWRPAPLRTQSGPSMSWQGKRGWPRPCT
jgi:hypothetical protein